MQVLYSVLRNARALRFTALKTQLSPSINAVLNLPSPWFRMPSRCRLIVAPALGQWHQRTHPLSAFGLGPVQPVLHPVSGPLGCSRALVDIPQLQADQAGHPGDQMFQVQGRQFVGVASYRLTGFIHRGLLSCCSSPAKHPVNKGSSLLSVAGVLPLPAEHDRS